MTQELRGFTQDDHDRSEDVRAGLLVAPDVLAGSSPPEMGSIFRASSLGCGLPLTAELLHTRAG